MHESESNRANKLKVYTDGAIRPERGISGLAAIVRDEDNRIRHWWRRRVGSLTCNEAEYAAAIFALERLAQRSKARDIEVALYSDSRILVDQMNGTAAAHAPALQKSCARLQYLVRRFRKVTFHHISREQNRLADALAYEAVGGLQGEIRPKKPKDKSNLWDEFLSTWRDQ